MNARHFFAALAAALAKPAFRVVSAPAAITAPRERGRFSGRLSGAIRSERGLSRGLHLLAGLTRIGRGGG